MGLIIDPWTTSAQLGQQEIKASADLSQTAPVKRQLARQSAECPCRQLGVDSSGVIMAQTLTEATVDDATTAIDLFEAVGGGLASVTADAAYDTVAFYEAAGARGGTVVVPPTKTANVSRRKPRSSARDRTITNVKQLGRRRWKKESGYHRQARAENAFFRYKSIIGEALRARSPGGQAAETLLACNALNHMTELGRPQSYSIGR